MHAHLAPVSTRELQTRVYRYEFTGANKFTRDLRIALVDRQVLAFLTALVITAQTYHKGIVTYRCWTLPCLLQEPASIHSPLNLLDAPANRVSTLTPASIQFLTDIGAWPAIAPPRCAPFSRMQVWDSTGSGFVKYDATHLSEQTMGHVAENGVIQHALLQQLRPNVNKMWPVSTSITSPDLACFACLILILSSLAPTVFLPGCLVTFFHHYSFFISRCLCCNILNTPAMYDAHAYASFFVA